MNLKEDGYISADIDEKGIAKVMQKVCCDSLLREKYGKKAHAYATKRFNNEEISTSFRKQLNDIIFEKHK